MLAFDVNSSLFLKITFAEIYAHLVKVSIFDHHNLVVQSRSVNCHEMVYVLSPGLYTLRLEMNGFITDEVFFMEGDRKYHIADRKPDDPENILSPPKQYSSALLGETYGSSHEYYTYPAIEWSTKDTNVRTFGVSDEPLSSLFVFLRFPTFEYYNEIKTKLDFPFYFHFEIRTEKGELVCRFEDTTEVVIDEHFGWLAFNRNLKSGLYFLIYNGNDPRQIPIYIYENWHTQLFMTLGHQPLYGSLRMFVAKERAFDPEEPTHKYIDILLDKMQNRDYFLDDELIYAASSGEFKSPMLGLICCYIYLMGDQTKNDDLFDLMFYNLRHFILKHNINSPDIQAIFILAAFDFPGEKYQIREVQGTPMLRLGFEALLKASVEFPGFIAEYSLNDFISENLYSDSPYTTFKPVPFLDNINVNLPQSPAASAPQRMGAREKSGSIFPSAATAESTAAVPDPYESNIIDTLNDSFLNYIKESPGKVSEESWLQHSISELLQNQKNLSINEISKNLGVSGNTVNRIFKQWKEGAARANGGG